MTAPGVDPEDDEAVGRVPVIPGLDVRLDVDAVDAAERPEMDQYDLAAE
jgi:hypothetical protein